MKNKKKVSASLIAVIFISIIITFTVTYTVMSMIYYKKYKKYFLIAETESCIDKYYYMDDVDKEKLIDGALSGFVSGLDDRYSHYQNLDETDKSEDRQAGVQIGIGITIDSTEDGYMKIIEITPDSSSSRAGLKPDDIITEVDGNDVSVIGVNEAIKLIKSDNVDTEIVMTVMRGDKTSAFNVKREKIDIISVEGRILEDDIACISISTFNDKTPQQLSNTISELVGDGAKGIIFDVRNNGGGLVTSVEKCLDPLLPEGDIAVSIDKTGKETTIIKSDANQTDIPMVILINQNSASGAELFSASLRDFKDVELVGVTSFGKGVMQDTFRLSDKSTVILTVARYKTTKSECYHGIGLIPDYEVEPDSESGEDNQLEKALEVIKGKVA